MSLNDPIADMLTRIRNAVRNKAPRVQCHRSKICEGIAKVLKEEGYIDGYDVIDDGKQGILRIDLRYGPHGEELIRVIQRDPPSFGQVQLSPAPVEQSVTKPFFQLLDLN